MKPNYRDYYVRWLTRVSSLRSRIFCGQISMQSALVFMMVFLAMVCPCVGEMIGPTPTLAELSSKRVLIFKGTVISNQAVEDLALEADPGFIVIETKFQIISKIKGRFDGTTVRFRHYEHDAHAPGGGMWFPEAFSFQEGRSYLIRTVPHDQFSSGKYDKLFDALDYKASNNDSYVIDLFCFYINRGYKDRAQKLHQTTTGYLTGVLDRAEKSPDSYQREE